jgi:site-specific DNA-cytosine methylase
MMRILDLCAGNKSVSNAMTHIVGNTRVTTVDVDPRLNPDICVDIRKWDYKAVFKPGDFDIVWASPPCTHYSRAKTVGERDFRTYDAIAKKCFEVIEYLRPNCWFVENPGKGGLMDKRPFMKRFEKYKHECCYCKYGKPYKKPTNIWTNVRDLRLSVCNKDTPCRYYKIHKKHKNTVQSGAPSNRPHLYESVTTNIKDRYSVPYNLIKNLIK